MTDNEGEEIWDIYDRERNPTGRFHRRGEPLAKGDCHLVVHVLIFSSDNRLLIQRRQPWKRGWPNLWDVSAAGAALAGETSRQAAEREIREELGVQLELSSHWPRFTVNFPQGFDDFWFLEEDIPMAELHPQPSEVAEVRWVNEEELRDLIRRKQFVPFYWAEDFFRLRFQQGAISREEG